MWLPLGIVAAVALASTAASQLSKPFDHLLELTWTTLAQRNDACGEATRNYTRGVQAEDPWALQVLDSEGVPSSGMLYGGVKSLGYLTECLRAPAPYRPQYCLLEVAVNTTPPSVPAALWSMLKKFPAKLATCLPAVCSPETIREALQNATSVQHWSANVTLTSCTDGQDDILRDPAALVVMTLLLLVVLLVVVGTLRERLRGSSMLGHSGSAERLVLPAPGGEKGCTEPSRLDRALCAFSIYSNGRKLLSTNSSGDSIDIIHGIRFLSMAWIIVGHSFSFAMTWLTFRNPAQMMSAPKTIMTQLLANGTFSVDSFFFLSGLLVTYHGIRRMQKEGSLNLPYFYIHRFFRLTPLMMVVIGFCATLLRHVTTGPDWLHTIESYDLWCRDNWWTNLLYLNNFIHREQMCLSHTWYSAVDFQLYAISPIVLYAISRGQVWYFASMAALFCITTGATFGLTLGYNLPAVPYFNNITPTWLLNEYYGLVYIKPYCRLGPFLVGLATGAYLQRRAAQSEEERANLRGWQSALLWLLAGLLAMAVIFGMYPANQGRLPPPALAAAYSSLARTAWAAGLAWVVLACVMGHAGYVRTILSCRVFAPLGRLTYAAYLIHPVVMAVFYGSREVVFDFDVYFMTYFILGNLVLTYAVSLAVSLLFESPIIGLERIFVH